MNFRGGSVFIKRQTIPSIVIVERATRFPLITFPYYRPRPTVVRRKWTFYSSIHGLFIDGVPTGIVTIRYSGGEFYEGPYIAEEFVDERGCVDVDARAATHWGIFRKLDGTTYEGFLVDNHFDPGVCV